MSHSLLSPTEHLPLQVEAEIENWQAPGRKPLKELLEGHPGMNDRRPLVLLGSERSAALIRDSLRGITDWKLPVFEGRLEGASSVWACAFSAGGTPTATLQGRGQASISLAFPDQEQLAAMQLSSDPSCQLVELLACTVQVEDHHFASPLCIAPWEGVMSVDGVARSVAANALPGGPRAMLMIEAAEWICGLASDRGLHLESPQDLQKACSNPAKQAELMAMLQPGLPHDLSTRIL